MITRLLLSRRHPDRLFAVFREKCFQNPFWSFLPDRIITISSVQNRYDGKIHANLARQAHSRGGAGSGQAGFQGTQRDPELRRRATAIPRIARKRPLRLLVGENPATHQEARHGVEGRRRPQERPQAAAEVGGNGISVASRSARPGQAVMGDAGCRAARTGEARDLDLGRSRAGVQGLHLRPARGFQGPANLSVGRNRKRRGACLLPRTRPQMGKGVASRIERRRVRGSARGNPRSQRVGRPQKGAGLRPGGADMGAQVSAQGKRSYARLVEAGSPA